MRIHHTAWFLTLAVGCASPAQPPATGQTGPPPAPMAYALFNVTGGAAAPIRLDAPIVLETLVSARAPVERASLVVVMPEVAAARASSWGEGYRMFGVGVRSPAIDSVVTRITPDSPLRHRSTVRIEAPGYYSVIVTARAADGQRREENSVPLVDPQHHSYYIWVDEEGGYVTRDFDATRLPLLSDGSAGPLRTSQRAHPMAAVLDSARAVPRTHAIVHGIVRDASGAAAADVRVQARAYMEGCPGRGAAEEEVRTDAAGRYRIVLRGWPAAPFRACVAVHADRDGAHGTARSMVPMNTARAGADSVRVVVQLSGGEV